jgi:hypothetical protein
MHETLTSPSCSNTCVRKGRNNCDAIERSLCDSRSGSRQKLLGMAIRMLLLRFEQFDQRTNLTKVLKTATKIMFFLVSGAPCSFLLLELSPPTSS